MTRRPVVLSALFFAALVTHCVPYAGGGEAEASPMPTNGSLDEHRECIRGFLAQIDPATGFIPDD